MSETHVSDGTGDTAHVFEVRKINTADVLDALRQGVDDFREKPSHYVFLALIYPIVGLVLLTWASGGNIIQLVYPLMTGFALVGPIAALGLYEISRRREQGIDTSWLHALEIRRSPALPAILTLSVGLLVLFVGWMISAQVIYNALYGSTPPGSITNFIGDVLTTGRGWTLILIGNAVGFVYALISLCTTVVSFPLMLDRNVSATDAVATSLHAMRVNTVPLLLWGLIVAVALLIGSIPLLVGLIIVIPVLGHATWHLYRKLVVAED